MPRNLTSIRELTLSQEIVGINLARSTSCCNTVLSCDWLLLYNAKRVVVMMSPLDRCVNGGGGQMPRRD